MTASRRTAAALIAATLLLAACGGGSSSSTSGSSSPGSTSGTTADSPAASGSSTAEEYANTVCGALATWIGDMQTMNQDMPTSFKSAKEGKQALTQAFAGAVESTNTLVETVEAAPAPDVEGGEEAHAAVVQSLKNVQTIMSDAQEEIAGLSTKNDAAFAGNIQGIATSLSTASSEATAGLGSITDPDLNQAFATAPACTSMATAASGAMPTT